MQKKKLSKANRLYHSEIPIIGLTGGMASGKSTVSKILKEQNIHLIDADALVKEAYKLGDVYNFIATNFPNVIENQNINFKNLREIVFSSEEYKSKIENIIYPKLEELFIKKLNNKNPFVVYDVPLLFEKNLHNFVDLTICIYSKREIQLQRIMERDSIEESLAIKMLDSQMDIEQKCKLSDIVIKNEDSYDNLYKNIIKLIGDINALFH